MDNRVSDIYTRRLRAGSRTYFFDVKVNSREDKYLVVTESRKTGPDIYQHDRVMVFEENMPNFLSCLYEALVEIGIDVSYPPQPVESNSENGQRRRNFEDDDTESIPRGITSDGRGFARGGPRNHNHNNQQRFDNNSHGGGARSPYSRHRHGGHQQVGHQQGNGNSFRPRNNAPASGINANNQRPNYRPKRPHNQRNYNDKTTEPTPPQRFYSTGGFDEF